MAIALEMILQKVYNAPSYLAVCIFQLINISVGVKVSAWDYRLCMLIQDMLLDCDVCLYYFVLMTCLQLL